MKADSIIPLLPLDITRGMRLESVGIRGEPQTFRGSHAVYMRSMGGKNRLDCDIRSLFVVCEVYGLTKDDLQKNASQKGS